MTEKELWEAFARACWECGKIQTVFPEHWLCEECRSKPDETELKD